MIRKIILFVALAACLVIGITKYAKAEDASAPTREIRVITRQITPFVLKDSDGYKGFSIELWQAIAKELGRPYHFVEKNNIREILAGVKAGEADAAIAAISVTSQRELDFDFSQPMFESGLQILTRADGGTTPTFFQQLWPLLTSTGTLTVLSFLAILIIIPAHIGWYVERNKENHLFPSNYFPGIFHAMYWATGAAAGQQPDPLFSGVGRILSTLLFLGSLFFTSYFTATITTSLTVQQLKNDINGTDDLAGKSVGTTIGSTAESFLKDINAKPLGFDKIEDALAALDGKKVDAVVFDAPVLLYYAANKGQGKVRLVGSMLKKENYGILFPQGSTLRKPVNEALLKLRENGVYDSLYAKWFATAQNGAP